MNTIKKKLTTVILLTVFIPFIIYTLTAHFFSLKDLEKKVMLNSVDLNQALGSSISEYFKKISVVSEEMANQQEILGFKKIEQKKTIEDVYKRNDFIKLVYVTDNKGNQISRSTGLNRDTSNRPWFNLLKKDLRPFITEASFSEKDESVVVSAAQPIVIDEKLEGALIVEADLSGFEKLLQEFQGKEYAKSYILDGAGNLIFESGAETLKEKINYLKNEKSTLVRDRNGDVVLNDERNPSEMKERMALNETLMKAARAANMGDSGSLIYRDASTKKIVTYSAFKVNEGTEHWALLIVEDYGYAMEYAMNTLKRSIFMSVFQLFILILLSMYISETISRPVRVIMEGVKAIKNGRLEHRISIKGKDEFSQLGDAFNGMASNLMDSYEQQIRKNRELKGINMELEASNSQLLAAVRQLNESDENLRSAFRRTVQGLISAVEAKDLYTESHSLRVANYSVALAEKLELGTRVKEDIWIAGVLHDIGKIGITDLILNKVGRLTEDEYREIKQHPVIACKMLSKIDLSRDIMEAIRYHHERFDGNGYPDNLKGKEIPIMASIISVADAFDAITSTRSYRNLRTMTEGVDEIVANAGTQFNIEVVSALLKLYKENPEVLEQIHLTDNTEMFI